MRIYRLILNEILNKHFVLIFYERRRFENIYCSITRTLNRFGIFVTSIEVFRKPPNLKLEFDSKSNYFEFNISETCIQKKTLKSEFF
jgi:hypothetical protein